LLYFLNKQLSRAALRRHARNDSTTHTPKREALMKGIIKGAVCAAIILAGGQAFADPMSSDSTSHHKMMQDCMARQKAKDSSIPKDDMKKTCKAELSGANSLGGVSTPNQTTPTTKGSPAPSTGSATSPPPQ
jgi:hypothetical protein